MSLFCLTRGGVLQTQTGTCVSNGNGRGVMPEDLYGTRFETGVRTMEGRSKKYHE